ncbi:SPOR domain-containing protein [Sphingomonas alba]|uniref:SPOR domain-containing protein n=1 Tax=Sphingomonas alba TaxID=2908208 RepID=A0ABT0RJ43_9SPHN|nr:SPOR domain-containing protein [Sphingomonas alba]MCL6682641.1 SPOR domain-containing protein [Sphingomonas alba]
MRLRIAIASVALALGSSVTAQAPTVKSGVEAWQRGDHAGAVAIWRNLAEKGNVDAAFDLGQAYRLGKGVPADSSQAKHWLEVAAKKGHTDAQVSLGLLLFDSGDRATAMTWLKRAAEKGEPRALLVVGTALFNGDGLPQDPVLGYAYVSRAAAQGLAPAKSTLTEMDKLMTVEERQKGVAIALAAAKGGAPKSNEKGSPPPKAKAKAPPPIVADVPVQKPPAKSETAKAVPAKGNWRVQLGAFSTRGAAEGLYWKLSGNGALSGRQAFYIPVGKITRLQAGPFESRAAATSACARLAPQACFAVEAR